MEVNKHMLALSVKNLKKYFVLERILEDVSFDIEQGERAAIVGPNGAGKTTTFKIIAGDMEYDSGSINVVKGMNIGYLSQIPVFPDGYTIREVIVSAFDFLYEIKSKMEKLETQMGTTENEDEIKEMMRQYESLRTEFEIHDGYNIDYKIDMIASGLGISKDDYNKEFNILSGGEKTRICMAKILAQNTDILLLDEPTNHLDMDSVEWLEGYLNSYKGTVVVISHDRYFMDRVVNKIIEIDDGKSEVYNGNYSFYVEEKQRRIEIRMKQYENQQKALDKMEDVILQYRNWSNYKAAMNVQRAVNRIDKLDKPKVNRKTMGLSFDISQNSGNDVITVKNLNKSYGDKKLFKDAEMQLFSGNKAVILGRNGIGKSTLIKMILGEENVDSGYIKLGTNVKPVYLEQQFDTLGGSDKSVMDYFMDETKILNNKQVRNILAGFLFFGEDVFKSVSALSGGERTRLKLAEIMNSSNNLLILDEPTNHLDIDSKEALEDAILQYNGTVLVISHDRYFINKIADTIYEVENGSITSFYGNYEYFKTKKENLQKKLQMLNNNQKNNIDNKLTKQATEEQKEKRKSRKSPAKELEKIEKKIEKLENDKAELEEQMQLPEVVAEYEKIIELSKQNEQIQNEIEKLYEEWEQIAAEV